MDCYELCSSLGKMDKKRIVPQYEAVLLLAIIDMFSKDILVNNEIYFDEKLDDAFTRTWKKILDSEICFSHYLTDLFWYMSSEPFWHVIPKVRHNEILSLMRNHNVHPSETKLKESVHHVELDQDLYFLMTMQSGRKELKRTLLENYFELSPMEISFLLHERKKNKKEVDPDSLYNSLFQNNKVSQTKDIMIEDNSNNTIYNKLSLDTKIEINLAYFNFLKRQIFNREVFVELFPNIAITLQKISNNDVKLLDYPESTKEQCKEFLTDLRFALMSNNDTMELMDQINKCIENIEVNEYNVESYRDIEPYSYSSDINTSIIDYSDQSDDNSFEIHSDDSYTNYTTKQKELSISSKSNTYKEWTTKEEARVIVYYKEGRSLEEIANHFGRSTRAIYNRLKTLGYAVDDPYKVVSVNADTKNATPIDDVAESKEWFIENYGNKCSIFNKNSEKIYSSNGKLAVIDGKPYRFYRTYSSISITELDGDSYGFSNGLRILHASSKSEFYNELDSEIYYEQVIGISIEDYTDRYLFKVGNKTFDSSGELVLEDNSSIDASKNVIESYCLEDNIRPKDDGDEVYEEENVGIDLDIIKEYKPKSKFTKIAKRSNNTHDCLLMLSIIDFVSAPETFTMLSFEELACRMIANAWELKQLEDDALAHEDKLNECIEYLISKSYEGSDVILNWNSNKELVYNEIKEYEVDGVFKVTIDLLMEAAPFIVDNFWIQTKDMFELITNSQTYTNACLYSITLREKDSFLEINPAWIGYLKRESYNLSKYYRAYYIIHEREKQ